MNKKNSFTNNILFNQEGITLIEILLVLALMLLIFAPAYNAFQVANKTWTHTEASNPKYTEADTVLTYLAQDIRQASRPSDNNNVKAVTIQDNNNGQLLTMYKYNTYSNEWEKIFYKVDTDTLRRALISKSEPDDIITVSQPVDSSPEWKVILTGLTNTSIFTEKGTGIDITSAQYRQAVDVKLQIGDSADKERFKPITVASSFLVRSREAGTIHDNPEQDENSENPPSGGDPSTIDVEELILSSSSVTLKHPFLFVIGGTKSVTISVTIKPSNATNPNVEWISLDPSLAEVEPNKNNNKTCTIKIPNNSSKTGKTTVQALCGGKVKSCSVEVKKGGLF